ncbi:hypothetical protein ACOMHN_061683 [Nucella lapillus]
MVPLPYLLISNMADRILLALAGVLMSVYSLHVEEEKEKNPNYRAACDFNEHMSCSRVLTSKYARGFSLVEGLLGKDHLLNARNCYTGIFFYLAYPAVDLVLTPWLASGVLLGLSVLGVVTSVYLAYVLFFILKDVCVVCITTYVLNGLLLYLNYNYYTALRPGP